MFKLVCFLAVVASVAAEPPRFRQRAFRAFARQESAEDTPASEGYNYKAPTGERLRLPIKSGVFARQEETSTSGGYSYPKPTESYGPPEEDQPATDVPQEATTTDPDDETTEDYDETATQNPQAETLRSLQAGQFRRNNAKFSRSRQAQKQLKANLVQPALQFQPVVYVDYPAPELFQPQYVYVFK